MDEYAYGFSTENTHYGPTRNPHNPAHVAGGSLRRLCGRGRGGDGAADAGLRYERLDSRAGVLLCGIWGLKPTFGRLTREGGTFPFVNSLDHLGPFAANLDLLAASYDVMQDGEPVGGVKGIEGCGLRVRSGILRRTLKNPLSILFVPPAGN